jgi:hypothetical protein
MAVRPPDFKSSGIRAERIIASGSSTNPRLLLIGSGAAGNDGITVNTSDLKLTGTGSDTWLFISGAVGGTDRVTFGGDVYVSGSILGAIVAATPAGSNTQVQFNTSNAFDADPGFVYSKSTQTLTVGNLTVTGSLTSISSSQVRVVDPIIILGSGSTGVNRNGGIAIASGSNTASLALVWGRVDINTWGAGILDVQNGDTASLANMDLRNIRAGRLEAGGPSRFVSSSQAGNLLLGAPQQVLVMSGGGSSSPNPTGFTDVNFFVSGSTDGAARTLFGGQVVSSGTIWLKDTSGVERAYITAGGEISGSGRLLVGGEARVAGQLSVTGSQTFGERITPGVESYHFVSGTIDLVNAAAKRAIFGGDSVFSGSILISKRDASLAASPGSASGKGVIYVKNSDGLLYYKDESNVEYSLTAGSAGVSEWVDRSNALVTTSSVSISGELGDSYTASSAGSDVYFFVSGSRDGSNSTVFGGNTVHSGSITLKDSSGAATITATQSNGNLTIEGDLTVNGGDVLTTASSVTVFPLNASTIAIGAAASTISIGNAATSNPHSFSIASARTGNVTLNLACGAAALGSVKNLNFGLGADPGSTTNIRIGTTDTGGTTNIFMSGSMQITGSIGLKGSITPDADFTYNLGTPSLRWQNVYTGDLHLRNNRGDWTIFEEEDFLCVTNNKTGKRYKMMLQPLD